jgi:SWI/SNF-related matrix-associated actin-dependent regulator 1 of chromatin subfamily A
MLKSDLYKFQKEAKFFHLDRAYSLNLCTMGMGKSLMALAVADAAEARTLIVCPAHLKRNWKEEVKKHTYLEPYVLGTHGSSVRHSSDVFVVNYEQLKKWREYILTCGIDLVIADEIHYLKNPKAKRTEMFFDILHDLRPDRFIGLTGSPIKNRVNDFYTLLKLCDLGYPAHQRPMDKFNYWTFSHTFCKSKQVSLPHGAVTKFYGVNNVDRLRALIKPRVFKRKLEDALDLPKLTHKPVMINEVDNAVALKLRQAYDDYSLKGTITDIGITRAKVEAAMAKVDFTVRYAKDMIDEGVPHLVIFTDHIEPAEKIYTALTCHNIDCRWVSGRDPASKRADVYQDFQDGAFQVLVATIGSSSTGINLTQSNQTIFNDFSWTPAELEQAIKRIHRIGQSKPCFIHYILMGPFDKMIWDMVTSKQATANRVLRSV